MSVADPLALASANLSTPMILFFVLGLLAALARSDMKVPEAIAKTLALYLMMAIGFKGGAAMAASGGVTMQMAAVLIGGGVLSAAIPFIAYPLLRTFGRLSPAEAGAVAGHYGSISIVTFVAATQTVELAGLDYEGYLVAVAAVMEAPAIVAAVWLARRTLAKSAGETQSNAHLLREVLLNASIVLLVGSFIIGWITGERGAAMTSAFFVAPFLGILCLFLLDMGLVAGRGLQDGIKSGALSWRTAVFGLVMPLVSASLAAGLGAVLGLSAGGLALLMTLSASASYIAAPAAMRLALPEARPAVYLTLSLAVTFPFNLIVGIPLYVGIARAIAG